MTSSTKILSESQMQAEAISHALFTMSATPRVLTHTSRPYSPRISTLRSGSCAMLFRVDQLLIAYERQKRLLWRHSKAESYRHVVRLSTNLNFSTAERFQVNKSNHLDLSTCFQLYSQTYWNRTSHYCGRYLSQKL